MRLPKLSRSKLDWALLLVAAVLIGAGFVRWLGPRHSKPAEPRAAEGEVLRADETPDETAFRLGGHLRYSSKTKWDAGTRLGTTAAERNKWNPRSSKDRYGFYSPVLADGYELCLQGFQVSDKALSQIQLARCAPLRAVNVSCSRVTDGEIDLLVPLTELLALDLARTRVTDGGMLKVARLKQLQWLSLDHTDVGDDGVKQLAGLSHLQWLSLGETRLTDASLEYLACLKKLEVLNLRGTNVTVTGLQKLQRALPDCAIQMEATVWPLP